MRDASEVQRLSVGQRAVLTLAVGLATGLAGYGAVGSYTTLADLAARVGVPLPGLVPIGIDGGLVGVVVLDLVLVWTGNPVGWLRQVARVLTVGTVAANVSAGWPDPVAVGLHAAAPLMLLVMVEAGRAYAAALDGAYGLPVAGHPARLDRTEANGVVEGDGAFS